MVDIKEAALVGQVVFGLASLVTEDLAAKGLLSMAMYWCFGVNLGAYFYKRRSNR